MKTAAQTEQVKTINRNCVVCGKGMEILINQDKSYLGGHYFGLLSIGKNKKAEYWECEKCFKN